MALWRRMGGDAYRVGTAITGAVDAALASDAATFKSAAVELAALPVEQAGLVSGAVVRSLLEEQHPDGLDAEGIGKVLAHCYQGASRWLPHGSVAVEALMAVLSSALGIHEPGVTYAEITGPPSRTDADWVDPELSGTVVRAVPPGPVEYARHAALLIADLLTAGLPSANVVNAGGVNAGVVNAGVVSAEVLTAGGRRLDSHLDSAFGEIARSETMEQP